MSWHGVMAEILRTLPALAAGATMAAWAAAFMFLGYRWGWRNGVRGRDLAQRQELTQARFQQRVVEERLDTERRHSKRMEVLVQQMVDSLAERQPKVVPSPPVVPLELARSQKVRGG